MVSSDLPVPSSEEDSSLVDYSHDLFVSAFAPFEEFRKTGHLCDISLVANDGGRFSAHRVVLAATIPFFKAMFDSDKLQSKQKEVKLSQFDSDALELILHFAYTGRVEISTKNVQSLFSAASFIQLSKFDEQITVNDALNNKCKIYAIGGLNTAKDGKSMVECYDPVSRQWSIVKTLGTVRSRVCVGVAVMQGKLYTIGGFGGSDCLRTVEVFDAQKSTWSEVAPLQATRSAMCATALGEYLYVCGGYDGINRLSSMEIYNPNTNTWEWGKSLKRPLSAAGVAVVNGCLYLMGGKDGNSTYNFVERYNREKDDWETVSPMQTKRSGLGVVAFDGKIYVAGGYDGEKCLLTAEVYDPVADTWTYISSMSLRRSKVSLVVNNGLIYAIAGFDEDLRRGSMEVYDPKEDAWSMGPDMVELVGAVGVGVIPIHSEEK